MKQIYTAIDIGSNEIKIAVCEFYNDKLYVLHSNSIKSKGIKKGLIVDNEAVENRIKQLILMSESELGISINKVIASVPLQNTRFEFSSSCVTIENVEGEITSSDVINAIQKSAIDKVLDDEELVTIMPMNFYVDGELSYGNLIGKMADTLRVETTLVIAPSKNVHSVLTTLENVGLEVVDITINPIGDYYKGKSQLTENKNGLLINIGHETTCVSLFRNGVIYDSSVINVGSKNIDSDISYLYRVSEKQANEIKHRYSSCHARFISKTENISVLDETGRDILINQNELCMVVSDRIKEIIDLAVTQGKNLTDYDIDFCMFSGGATELLGFKLLIREMFFEEAIVIESNVIGARSNKFSPVLGNIEWFYAKLLLRGKIYSMIDNRLESMLIDKNNSRESNIVDKLYGLFFEN